MSEQNWTFGRLGALAIVIGFWSSTVMAEPIPEEVLGAEKDECQLDCEESNNTELCQALCSCAMKRIDKCAKRNIVHRNNASRKKSSLAKRVALIGA